MWIILLGEKICKKKTDWMSQMLELSDKHFKEDMLMLNDIRENMLVMNGNNRSLQLRYVEY